jgi:hypothetical protein
MALKVGGFSRKERDPRQTDNSDVLPIEKENGLKASL